MKQNGRLALFVAGCLMLGLAGCEKKDGDEQKKEAKAEEPDAEKKKQKADKADKKKGAADQSPHSSSIPGTENQLKWDQDIPNVEFAITSPEEGQTLKSGETVEVEFDVTKYRIGNEIGQHIHFILDNDPYHAHYVDGKAKIYKDVEPGTHTLRAFPARHYHLSIKEGRPFAQVTFHVEEKSEDFSFDPDKPYITYSRPKGTYSKEAAQELLLDFYKSNVELGEDAKVVYAVDGEKQGELTEWTPVLLDPLKPGEHDINLKLVDGDGKLIENGGYNDTTRTITVKE